MNEQQKLKVVKCNAVRGIMWDVEEEYMTRDESVTHIDMVLDMQSVEDIVAYMHDTLQWEEANEVLFENAREEVA